MFCVTDICIWCRHRINGPWCAPNSLSHVPTTTRRRSHWVHSQFRQYSSKKHNHSHRGTKVQRQHRKSKSHTGVCWWGRWRKMYFKGGIQRYIAMSSPSLGLCLSTFTIVISLVTSLIRCNGLCLSNHCYKHNLQRQVSLVYYPVSWDMYHNLPSHYN